MPHPRTWSFARVSEGWSREDKAVPMATMPRLLSLCPQAVSIDESPVDLEASAAECPGNRTGGFPLARYRRRRGWVDLRPSAYGTPRAKWCAPATITARVLRSRLQNHVEGRLRRAPDALEAARADNLAK